MNIFALDHNPIECAKAHCDKHLASGISEGARILSSACFRFYGKQMPGLKKPYNPNNRFVDWVLESKDNLIWLNAMVLALDDVRLSLNKESHKSLNEIERAYSLLVDKLPDCKRTDFALCEMPYRCLVKNDSVQSYRNYYLFVKRPICTWKNREKPDWWID